MEISKLEPGDCQRVANIRYTNHGCGIVQFHRVADIPSSDVINYINENVYVPSCGLEIVEIDGETVGRDFTGKIVPMNFLNALPMRFGGGGTQGPVKDDSPQFILDFFTGYEKALYRSLIRYVDIHPMILNTIWWKGRGHILKYLPGSSLGMHNDNDTNTQIKNGQRYFSGRDIARYQTVNALIYLNDDYGGGEFRFPYANLTLKPDAGDIVFFPANYMGSHGVAPVTSGERFTYLAQFGHGVPKKEEGPSILEAQESTEWLPLVFLPFLGQDLRKFVEAGFSDLDDSKDQALGLFETRPLNRNIEGPATGTFLEYDESL